MDNPEFKIEYSRKDDMFLPTHKMLPDEREGRHTYSHVKRCDSVALTTSFVASSAACRNS
jgi:hypothetical protein